MIALCDPKRTGKQKAVQCTVNMTTTAKLIQPMMSHDVADAQAQTKIRPHDCTTTSTRLRNLMTMQLQLDTYTPNQATTEPVEQGRETT